VRTSKQRESTPIGFQAVHGSSRKQTRETTNARCRWKYLEDGITRIMTDLEQGMDMQMYMGVYTYVTSLPAFFFFFFFLFSFPLARPSAALEFSHMQA
jgi:hypothetical protein